MKVLGCTGGIGSGKSYVASIFNKMGIPVYDSDNRAKLLYDIDSQLRMEMEELLKCSIVVNGIVQRSIIAEKIFGNRNLLAQVEKLVHPAVVRDFCRWKEALSDASCENVPPFVIIESAILLEKPEVKGITDRTVAVSAPLELRIERVVQRDKTDREKVLARIASQWSDEQRNAIADFIIFANGRQALLPQIHSVYEVMCNLP